MVWGAPKHSSAKLKMSELRIGKRIRTRLGLKLPVRVHCRETPDFDWVEITRLINVTPFGAAFTLKHAIETGRLLHLTIPLPRQLRVFDHIEDQYKIWALVRYVKSPLPKSVAVPVFEVGVAFVGKHPPRSYHRDPAKRYEIAIAPTEAGPVEEADRMLGPLGATGADCTSHRIPVEILLETLDDKGDVFQSENTVTESISSKGATLFNSLTIEEGRFVRLHSDQFNLTVFAAVRSSTIGADGVGRIHVEFIDREWPI
jgi:hypothetical protein